jgi:membrane fusion protein (multidrug efflux system)
MMLLGVLSLGVSIAPASLSVHPPSRGQGSADSPGRPDRRAVAVAYVDVEGGVRPLYPAVPGRVVDAPVPEGKEVEAGTVLLRIDDALAQTRLKEAKIDYEAAKEKLVQAKKLVAQHQMKVGIQQAGLDAARKKMEAAQNQANKAKDLFKQDLAGSGHDLRTANELVEEAKAAVRAEQGKLDLAKSFDPESAVRLATYDADSKKEQVEKAQLGVRECQLIAPCKGVILRRLVNVGEVLGQTPNRPAIEFCPSGDRIVRAEVEQEFAGKLFVGQKADITDDITGSGEWHGEVTRISDWYTQRRAVLLEPMQYNDIRTLEVIIRLKPDAKNPLRINQRVRVKLAGER